MAKSKQSEPVLRIPNGYGLRKCSNGGLDGEVSQYSSLQVVLRALSEYT